MVAVRHLESLRRGIFKSTLGRRLAHKWEAGTGLAIEHVVGGLQLCIMLLAFCGLGASFLTNMVGIVYPALQSLKAIETDGKDDDTEWLIYWVVYAAFLTLEHFIDAIIYWIPFFYPLKIVFLVWLFAPEYKGANTIYIAAMPLFRSRDVAMRYDTMAELSRKHAQSTETKK